MSFYKKVGVVGAGVYGTALAQRFSTRVSEVVILSKSQEVVNDINATNTNRLLGDVLLNKNISCVLDYDSMKDCDVIFVVVPSRSALDVCSLLKQHQICAPVILCSKGVDVENARLISDGIEEILDNEVAIFSGPSFAYEVATGLPFGVSIASKNIRLATEISENLAQYPFFIKPISDYVGLQIVGAFKNILAIGCGITSGLRLGCSAVSQLIVNGIEEMINLSTSMGGKKDTFWEIGGIGDIMLTCTNDKSRNFMFGKHIANGGNIQNWSGHLVEGAFTAKAIPLFEEKYQVSMKILYAIYERIYPVNREL